MSFCFAFKNLYNNLESCMIMKNEMKKMMIRPKKTPFVLSILFLILLFLTISCTITHLKHSEILDDEVAQLLRSAPSGQSYPDADILTILEENIIEVFKDGRHKEFFYTVFKIINERGKAKANIKVGYNSFYETASIIYARTITPDGKIIPLKKNAIQIITPFEKFPSFSDYKELSFSMPGVTIGSVIEYKIVKEARKPIIKGKFSSSYIFQWFNPTLLSRYKVITPKDINLKYFLLNPLSDVQLSPKVIHQGDKKIYLWEYKNIPQIIAEDSMPPWDEIAFHILVTNMESWEEFSRWWLKNVERKTEPNVAIREKVTELTKNLSTIKEKVEAIFDYVKREIRYIYIDLGKSGYEPESAQNVFENKYGDCKDKSTLLISMLKAAGISAHYVLIPTHEIRNLIKDFPYPFQFNHCIVAVEKGGEYHFIDPVAENYRIDYLPSWNQNRDVLIFKDQLYVFGRTPLAKAEENASYSQHQIKIGADGSIEGEVKILSSGEVEASWRSFFINYSPTGIKEYFENRVDKISPRAKLLKYTHTDPLNFKERFVVNMKYDAIDYCKKARDVLIFEVPEIGEECGIKGKKERRYPLVVRNNFYSKNEVELNIPEGYEVYYLPEPVELKNQYFEFRSAYRREGEKIFYQGEFIKNANRITPLDYPVYHQFCQVMEQSFRRDVLFIAKKNILGN